MLKSKAREEEPIAHSVFDLFIAENVVRLPHEHPEQDQSIQLYWLQ